MQYDDGFWRSAYRQHGPAILAFLRRRLPGGEEAEDLLQETFVRAIRAGSFRPDGNLRAYLMRTARNLLVNRLRRPRLVVNAAPARGGDAGEAGGSDGIFGTLPDTAASPEQRAALARFKSCLERALEGMSEDHRRAFALAIRDQRPYREIADLTGWSPSQVKINVYRARQRLIRELGDVLPDARWRLI